MDILAMIMLPVLLLIVAVTVGSSAPFVGVMLGGIGLALFFTMRSLRTRHEAGEDEVSHERRLRSLPDGHDHMPSGEPPVAYHREHWII
jgi:hypothetical protein